MAEMLHVAGSQVQPFDMVEGLFVREVYENARGCIVVLGELMFAAEPVDGRCEHRPVWDQLQERRRSGLVSVVRGFAHPRPAGCTCS
ncbi:MAG: hypothetical protein GEV08_16845 [Acidimicrobiia bacterium]|nr:hypothetical protein [Acidimicrobiia bacterium]